MSANIVLSQAILFFIGGCFFIATKDTALWLSPLAYLISSILLWIGLHDLKIKGNPLSLVTKRESLVNAMIFYIVIGGITLFASYGSDIESIKGGFKSIIFVYGLFIFFIPFMKLDGKLQPNNENGVGHGIKTN